MATKRHGCISMRAICTQVISLKALADRSSGAALSPTAPTASKWELELFPYSAAKCGILEV